MCYNKLYNSLPFNFKGGKIFMERIKVAHLVKSEDLNHHGTLFAGRMAEWFVEACFICAAKKTEKPESILCVNIHGLTFSHPADLGNVINMEVYIARAKRTSFTVYCKITRNNSSDILSDGFITFVFVGENRRPTPHHIVLDEPADEEERNTRLRAEKL
jgi:acyl-CoA hydrolase